MNNTFDASKVKGSITLNQVAMLRAAADDMLLLTGDGRYFHSGNGVFLDWDEVAGLRWAGALRVGNRVPSSNLRFMEITDKGRDFLTRLPEGV